MGSERTAADPDLAARIAAGDAPAEAELVARYREGLLVMFRHRFGVPSEAEDLCQETLRIALENLRSGRLHAPGKLASYLWGIAAHLSREARERRERQSADSETTWNADQPAARPDQRLLAAERARLLRAALRGLARRDQQVLTEFYLGEREKAEVCERMELSPSQFDVIKFRALRRLARIFEQTTGGGERSGASKAHYG